MKHPDVLVIGGGAIGLSCAYSLARVGLKVEVVDKGELAAEASWAGAGIIPPGNSQRAATPYDRLRAVSSNLFPSVMAELHERTGIDCGYRVCGGVEFLSAAESAIVDAWRAEDIAVEAVGQERLRELVPGINDVFDAAWHLPGMAQVRNPWYLRALIAACKSVGVSLRPHTAVEGWKPKQNRIVAAALDNDDSRSAGQFLIACGAWEEFMVAPLGIRTAIHPVRGQIVLYRCPSPPFRPILLQDRNYIVPRDDGRVLVGSTEEPEAGFIKQTTPAGINGLTAWAAEMVPALAQCEIESTWAGLRPGSADGLPTLGALPGWSNVFVAAGHFRAGIQLSTGTALVMTECMTGKQPTLPIEHFRAGREPSAMFRSAFRS